MTTKVGVYRSYYGPVPTDSSGKALPKDQWPKKRPHSWVVRWYGLDRQRYSRSFKTRKEAERLYESKQQEVRVGRADPPPPITLAEFSAEHAKLRPGQVAARTIEIEMRDLNLLIERIGAGTRLAELTSRQAEAFVAWRLSQGLSQATVNKDIRTLKRLFNLAISPRGYLRVNPFAAIKQRRHSGRPIRFVSAQEFRQLVDAAPTLWWRAFLSLAYATGARLQELLHLTWADVDFAKERIRIVRKGAEGHLARWEPKDHEGRVLPCPAFVFRLLADLQIEAAERCPYLFVSKRRWDYIQEKQQAGEWKEERILVNNLHRQFKAIRRQAGVRCTFHDLRRTSTTNLANVLPIHVVQRLAGHSDIKTTQQYYLSVQETDMEKARRAISRCLAESQTDQKMTN